MSTEKIITHLKNYITETMLAGKLEVELTPDFQLLKNGVVDSLGLFKLVSFMEEAFSVKIAPGEIIPSNFETIEKMEEMVRSKLEASKT